MKNTFLNLSLCVILSACLPVAAQQAPASPGTIARGFAAEACAKKGIKPATPDFEKCVVKSAPQHMAKARKFHDEQMNQHYQQRTYNQQQQQAIARALLAPAPVQPQPVYQIVQPQPLQPYQAPQTYRTNCTTMPMGGGFSSTNCTTR